MGNVCGVRVGCKSINSSLVARGYRAHWILRKPLLTSNHRQLRLDWARGYQNLTVAGHLWRWVTFSAVLCWWPHDFVDCRENASIKAAKLPGWSWRVLCSWLGHSTGDPNHPLCCWIGTSMAWCIGTFYGTPYYRWLGSTLEIIFATKMTMLRLIVPG